jgi:hypothetical protein
MEDIKIISSIIDEYKEHFKDNDYKNCMDALMRFHNIKQPYVLDNYFFERVELIDNSETFNFRKISKISKNFLIHNNADKYIFDEDDIYSHFLDKYFRITGNDNDVVDGMTLCIKLSADKKDLFKFLSKYPYIKQFVNKQRTYFSGIKELP